MFDTVYSLYVDAIHRNFSFLQFVIHILLDSLLLGLSDKPFLTSLTPSVSPGRAIAPSQKAQCALFVPFTWLDTTTT